MDREKFNKLLKQADLTRKEFAEIIGMQYSSVNNWGSSQDFPRWVESWLQNYLKSKKFDRAKEIFKEEFKEE